MGHIVKKKAKLKKKIKSELKKKFNKHFKKKKIFNCKKKNEKYDGEEKMQKKTKFSKGPQNKNQTPIRWKL